MIFTAADTAARQPIGGLDKLPVPGANVVFTGSPSTKIVGASGITGISGPKIIPERGETVGIPPSGISPVPIDTALGHAML